MTIQEALFSPPAEQQSKTVPFIELSPSSWSHATEITHYAPTEVMAYEWVEAMRIQEGVLAYRVLHCRVCPRHRKGVRWGSKWWMGQIYLPEDIDLKPTRPGRRKIARLDDRTIARWRVIKPGWYTELNLRYRRRKL